MTVVPDVVMMFGGPWGAAFPVNARDLDAATLEQQEAMLQAGRGEHAA